MKNCGEVLRGTFGKDLFSKIIAEEIKNSKAKLIILPNVRTNIDLIHLKKLPGFVLVAITADPKIRYERLTKRGQNADDKTKTWDQFKNDQHLSTEIHIKKLAKKAHYHLDNNGNERELYSQIEEIFKKLR
jgi:dephospho-CoA kinase